MYNPAKFISLYGGQRFRQEVPCGQCAECREAKRTDIYFRTYYECLDTFQGNGYIWFDTLTYRDADLPHVSDNLNIEKGSSLDFSCFRAEDIRLFFVRLRRMLTYHGFDVKNNLKYFVCSEYGKDNEYIDDKGRKRKGTNRPHYHVLFFVKNDIIHPYEFTRFVNLCWQKGNTDGIDYKPTKYVDSHIFGPKYNSDTVHLQAVCNYVAKYVLKNDEYEDKLKHRILQVFSNFTKDPEHYIETFSGKKRYKSILKLMKPYYRWSNGYGIYGLEYELNKEDDLLYQGKMAIPDKTQVKRFAPLSSYLEHKRYYETSYTEDGRLYWRLNAEGRMRKYDRTVAGMKQFNNRFIEWYENMSDLLTKEDVISWYDWTTEEWKEREVTSEDIYKYQKDIKDKVAKYLGDRDPILFAMYCIFYKGRVKSQAQIERERQGIYRVDDIQQFFWKGLKTAEEIEQEGNYLYNYSHPVHARHFQDKILSTKSLHHEDMEGNRYYDFVSFEYGYDEFDESYHGKFVDKYNKTHSDTCYSVKSWEMKYVIDENSDERFKDFDKLYNLYVKSQMYKNNRKQKTYDYIEDLKKRYKDMYVKTI